MERPEGSPEVAEHWRYGSAEPAVHLARVVAGMKPGGASRADVRWALDHLAPGAEAVLVYVRDGSDETSGSTPEELTLLALEGGADGTVVVRTGNPASQLAQEAKERGAGLMVLGPGRRSRSVSGTFSSTAEEVVHHWPLPVLVIQNPPAGPPRKILVPVGPEGVGVNVARWVDELSRRPDAEVTAVHVVDLTAPAQAEHEAYQKSYLQELQAQLEARLVGAGLSPSRVRSRVVVGEPGPGIHAVADELGAELLVVGSHRTGVMERLLSQSLAGRVLRSASCPVLLVPEQSPAKS